MQNLRRVRGSIHMVHVCRHLTEQPSLTEVIPTIASPIDKLRPGFTKWNSNTAHAFILLALLEKQEGIVLVY